MPFSACGNPYGPGCYTCDIRGCDEPTLALAAAVEGCDYDELPGCILAAAVTLLGNRAPHTPPSSTRRLLRIIPGGR